MIKRLISMSYGFIGLVGPADTW